MKNVFKVIALAALVIAAASCSKTKAEQMQMVDNIQVVSVPEVLEAIGGQIPEEITVTYPKDYFHPQATMVVTPVLVYEGGQQNGPSFVYQGEKVKDNNKVVPSDGGSVTEKVNFKYVNGCEKCYVELRSVVYYNGKSYECPAIKVADGCRNACLLVDKSGACQYLADGYRDVISQVTEGQILYDVNSAVVKNNQLKSESINEFKAALGEMLDNDRVTVKGTKIIAYASPEGGEKLNAKLSDNRAGTAQKAWKKISKGMDAAAPEIQSIGQDWEGFQQAVANSNIKDKDLILRVLSMYSDPAVRESEIKNMSQIYTEIADKVFPDLRRARFVTEAEFKNYSVEELEAISKDQISLLNEESLMHLAANAADDARKENLLKLVADKFNSDAARFNLGKLYLDEDKPAVAVNVLDKIKNVTAAVNNLKGIAQMRLGDFTKAAELFKKAGTDEAKQNLAALDLIAGDYKAAASKLAGQTGVNAALAQLLNGDEAAASKALTGDDATSDYLRAVIAARKGDVAAAKKYIESAGKKDPALKERAAKDIEFAAFAN